jgi:hypothetical protein
MATTTLAQVVKAWFLPVAALLSSAIAIYFLYGVFPTSAHADDWPGPYVGAAIGLELAGAVAFVGLLLAAISWRPRTATLGSRIALVGSTIVYFGVGACFPFVGLAPFCGASVSALAKHQEPLLLELLGTRCGLFVLAEFVVPLAVVCSVLFWKVRRGVG